MWEKDFWKEKDSAKLKPGHYKYLRASQVGEGLNQGSGACRKAGEVLSSMMVLQSHEVHAWQYNAAGRRYRVAQKQYK